VRASVLLYPCTTIRPTTSSTRTWRSVRFVRLPTTFQGIGMSLDGSGQHIVVFRMWHAEDLAAALLVRVAVEVRGFFNRLRRELKHAVRDDCRAEYEASVGGL